MARHRDDGMGPHWLACGFPLFHAHRKKRRYGRFHHRAADRLIVAEGQA